MYEKYTTDAVVLRNETAGEHDSFITLYTRDFGRVHARASAARRMESKMRSALPLFAHASVSLVRGTRGWRIAGARAMVGEALHPQGVHTYARIVQLLTRLVRGEEQHEYLFEVLRGARETCARKKGPELAAAELLCVARILFALGYLSTEALASALFTHAQYADADLAAVHESKQDILGVVNKAIAETQL